MHNVISRFLKFGTRYIVQEHYTVGSNLPACLALDSFFLSILSFSVKHSCITQRFKKKKIVIL